MDNSKGNTRKSEIVFFDVETTAPSPEGRWWLLEFGAILVCPRKLVEVGSYDTLIRPGDLSAVSRRFTDVESIASAPTYSTSSTVRLPPAFFFLLFFLRSAIHDHRFDCPRIREAFAEIGRAAPEPAGVIDSLNVLAAEFGRRAGDLKMATLATYFGIGTQKHRSLDDARMNLEVLKHCATVLLLESSLPHALQLGARDGAVTRRSSAAASAPAAAHRRPAMAQTKLPFTPVKAAPVTNTTAANNKSGGKRDSLGKLVASNSKPAAEGAGAAPLSVRRPTSAAATTPFHMILRHSRAVIR
ncbi:hypothetical protein HU200_000003 [Digitaria exilis]|uniref:Exonuclease domain-containing protein n=1 Tax=Digitaria exilis TaxID=1010633 RepID=A0A835G3D8_9POAL|nr:hypothetical protein HU200_000003 [Digitaria exilis]